jgi:hypothetical protein
MDAIYRKEPRSYLTGFGRMVGESMIEQRSGDLTPNSEVTSDNCISLDPLRFLKKRTS